MGHCTVRREVSLCESISAPFALTLVGNHDEFAKRVIRPAPLFAPSAFKPCLCDILQKSMDVEMEVPG